MKTLMNRFSPSSAPSWGSIKKGFLDLLLASVGALMMLWASPIMATTSQKASGLGIYSALKVIKNVLQGPIVVTAGTIAVIAILGTIIFRTQRGESIKSLAAVMVAVIMILNIDVLLNLFNITAAVM